MQQVLGEYEVKLDAKGRFRLPSQLIRQLGEQESHQFVINRGIETHLTLRTKKVWDSLVDKLKVLSDFKKAHRAFLRSFYRGASEMSLDSSDRLLVPKILQEYANMDKDLIIFCYRTKIEIWAKEEHQKMVMDEIEDFSALAEQISDEFDLGL